MVFSGINLFLIYDLKFYRWVEYKIEFNWNEWIIVKSCKINTCKDSQYFYSYFKNVFHFSRMKVVIGFFAKYKKIDLTMKFDRIKFVMTVKVIWRDKFQELCEEKWKWLFFYIWFLFIITFLECFTPFNILNWIKDCCMLSWKVSLNICFLIMNFPKYFPSSMPRVVWTPKRIPHNLYEVNSRSQQVSARKMNNFCVGFSWSSRSC